MTMRPDGNNFPSCRFYLERFLENCSYKFKEMVDESYIRIGQDLPTARKWNE